MFGRLRPQVWLWQDVFWALNVRSWVKVTKIEYVFNANTMHYQVSGTNKYCRMNISQQNRFWDAGSVYKV